ncbi:MAG: outer membrane protein assembly factor BamB family protein [Planctomycetota bacterium]|jgi:outer membrane protein assembly factor BamB
MSTHDKPNRHLLRRVLVPVLIVALPISAMIAFILHYKRMKSQIVSTPPRQEVSFGNENWSYFRGDESLTGTATGQLPETLKLAWKFQTGDAIKSSAVIADGTVFITSMDGFIYAVELETGTECWRFEADDELEASAVYYEQTLFLGSSGGTFYAIDAGTGNPRWKADIGSQIAGAANIVQTPSKSATVVFGCYDSTLYAYDTESGKQILKYEADNYINGSVAVAGSIVSFGSCDASVYLVPIDDPEQTKLIDTGSYVAANPVIDDGVVYAGNYEGRFIAADVATGKILWEYSEAEDAFFSSAAVDADHVVVGCRDQKLYCFNRLTGKVMWTFSGGDNFDSSPVICGNTVAVGNDDGRLYLVNLASGAEIYSYTLGDAIVSSAAIAQNHVLIGCDNGTLYAFRHP